MDRSEEDLLSSVGAFKDSDVFDDLDMEEEEALLRFSEHEDSLLGDEDQDYMNEVVNDLNKGEKVQVIGRHQHNEERRFNDADEDDILEVEVENDLDMFSSESSKVVKEVQPEEAEVTSSGLAVSGEEEEQAEEEEAKLSSSIIQDDEEEDEEADNRRNRFHNERQNIINLSKSRKRTHIPDTLESVVSEEETAKVMAFMNQKQEQRNRRQMNPRHPGGRGMRGHHHPHFQNRGPPAHLHPPRNMHQQQIYRQPRPWDGPPMQQGYHPPDPYKGGPPPATGPPPPVETPRDPFHYPPPADQHQPDGGCPLPRKILINPHFKGSGPPPHIPPPAPPAGKQPAWHEDVSLDQLDQSFQVGAPLLPDPAPPAQHPWPPAAPPPQVHPPHPQEHFFDQPPPPSPQGGFRHFQEPPRHQQHFSQPPPGLPYPLRDGPFDSQIHHMHGPPPPNGLPPVHAPPPPYPPPREPPEHFQSGPWNSSPGGLPPPPHGPPLHRPPPPPPHGLPNHFGSRGYPGNRDGFAPDSGFLHHPPPLANQMGPPPLHSPFPHHPNQPPHGMTPLGPSPPSNHHHYPPPFLDSSQLSPHSPVPPMQYPHNLQQTPGGPKFSRYQRGGLVQKPLLNSSSNIKRGMMVGIRNQRGQIKGKWVPNKKQALTSPAWQGKPKLEARKPPIQTGNIKEVPIVESIDMAQQQQADEEDEETRQLRQMIEEQRKLREEVMRRKEERRRQMAAQRLQEVQAKKNSVSASGLVTIEPTTNLIAVTPQPITPISKVKQQQQQQQQPRLGTAGSVLINVQPTPTRLPVKQRLGHDGSQQPPAKKMLVVRKQGPTAIATQQIQAVATQPKQVLASVPIHRQISPVLAQQKQNPPRFAPRGGMQPQLRQRAPGVTPQRQIAPVAPPRQTTPAQTMPRPKNTTPGVTPQRQVAPGVTPTPAATPQRQVVPGMTPLRPVAQAPRHAGPGSATPRQTAPGFLPRQMTPTQPKQLRPQLPLQIQTPRPPRPSQPSLITVERKQMPVGVAQQRPPQMTPQRPMTPQVTPQRPMTPQMTPQRPRMPQALVQKATPQPQVKQVPRQQFSTGSGSVLRQLVPEKSATVVQRGGNLSAANVVPASSGLTAPVRAPVPVRVTGQPMTNVRPTIRPVGRGTPPIGRGTPPIGRGIPPVGRGTPPIGRGTPPIGRGTPPIGRGISPIGRGIQPIGRGTAPPPGRTVLPVGRQVIQVLKQAQTQGTGTESGKRLPAQQQPQRLVKMSQVTSVVISKLSASASEAQLMKLCRTVGPVENIKLTKTEGKAVVKFKQAMHADQFQKKFQRFMLDLSMIEVAFLQT